MLTEDDPDIEIQQKDPTGAFYFDQTGAMVLVSVYLWLILSVLTSYVGAFLYYVVINPSWNKDFGERKIMPRWRPGIRGYYEVKRLPATRVTFREGRFWQTVRAVNANSAKRSGTPNQRLTVSKAALNDPDFEASIKQRAVQSPLRK